MNPLELALAEIRRRARQEHGLHLTRHAIDRMGEMGVSLDQLGRIVREGSSWLQRSGVSGQAGRMHWHPELPEWAAVTAVDSEPPLVITVVFRRLEEYERRGRTCEPARTGQ